MNRGTLTVALAVLLVSWPAGPGRQALAENDRSEIDAQVHALRHPHSAVRESAAAVLRQIFSAKPGSDDSSVKAAWTAKIGQIQPGMTEAQVFGIFPRYPGTNDSRSQYRLDPHWMLKVDYDNQNLVKTPPELIRSALLVAVPVPTNYTGTWIQWYANGQKGLESQCRNGKFDGLSTHFWDNGSKAHEQNYKDNALDGPTAGWHVDGKKSYEGHYRFASQHGTWTRWYANGGKQSETEYKDGQCHGRDAQWQENGRRNSNVYYADGIGNGENTHWDNDGNLIWVRKFENGELVYNRDTSLFCTEIVQPRPAFLATVSLRTAWVLVSIAGTSVTVWVGRALKRRRRAAAAPASAGAPLPATASVDSTAPASRPWLRFSLRKLFVLVTILGVALGWLAVLSNRARQQQASIDAVKRMHGFVHHDYEVPGDLIDDWWVRELEQSWLPKWFLTGFGHEILHYVGEADIAALAKEDRSLFDPSLAWLDGFPRLRHLYLSGVPMNEAGLARVAQLTSLEKLQVGPTPLEDGDIAQLKNLTQLVYLEFNASSVSDKSLVAIGQLSQLKYLILNGDCSRITDRGIAELSNLKQLQYLWLDNSAMTDASLAVLGRLPKLETLCLQGHKFTDGGLAHLKNLPQLTELWLGNGDCAITDAESKGSKSLRICKFSIFRTPASPPRGSSSCKR